MVCLGPGNPSIWTWSLPNRLSRCLYGSRNIAAVSQILPFKWVTLLGFLICRKICLNEKGVLIGAILINQVEDLGILQRLIRERKHAEFLKSRSFWKSPMNYGHAYKNILQGRL